MTERRSFAVALAITAAVTIGLVAEGVARAEIQKNGPEQFPGKNEISIHFPGIQEGFGGETPGGLKLTFDFAHRISEAVWLDFGFSGVLGFSNGFCAGGDPYGCSGFGGAFGTTFAPHGGIKIKFKTPIPLVPYLKVVGDFIGIFNRPCGDSGFALAGTANAGAKYFLTPRFGVGIELGFTVGPAFYGNGNCLDRDGFYTLPRAHNELYVSAEFGLGAELNF